MSDLPKPPGPERPYSASRIRGESDAGSLPRVDRGTEERLDPTVLACPPGQGGEIRVPDPARAPRQVERVLEPVFLPLGQEGKQAQLDRAFLQFRGPLGGDFRHRTRLVSETRYMAVRGPAASGGRTSFTRCGDVRDVMVDASSREEKKEKGGDAPLTSACVAPGCAGTARG